MHTSSYTSILLCVQRQFNMYTLLFSCKQICFPFVYTLNTSVLFCFHEYIFVNIRFPHLYYLPFQLAKIGVLHFFLHKSSRKACSISERELNNVLNGRVCVFTSSNPLLFNVEKNVSTGLFLVCFSLDSDEI